MAAQRRTFARMALAALSVIVAASCASAPERSASWAARGERVRWSPGYERRMDVGDTRCVVDARPGVRQRIVSIAVSEWGRFRYPIIDFTGAPPRLVPSDGGAALVPDEINPALPPEYRQRSALRLGLMEDDPSAMLAIGAYWAVTNPSEIRKQNRLWEVDAAAGWATPWSAAFVSYVMCQAGLSSEQFPPSFAHVDYIGHAYDSPAAAYRYQANGAGPIAPGDLICSWRGAAEPLEFENGRRQIGQPEGPVGSHCDIVVRIDESRRRIYAIGGNVAQAVSMTIAGYTGDPGHVALEAPPANPGARTWFGMLRLNIANAGDASLEAAFSAGS